MTLSDIQFIFNRALILSVTKKKWLLIFSVLALCGFLTIFLQGLATHSSRWVQASLCFLSFFISAGLLFSLGILLVRIYYHEVRCKEFKYRDIFLSSWDLLLASSYFTIPIVLSFLLLWMGLTIFVFLRSIPAVGSLLGAILSFAPFIINMGTILLFFGTIALLYLMTPILALNGLDKSRIFEVLKKRGTDFFSNILLGLVAAIPFLIVFALLAWSWRLTMLPCLDCKESYFLIQEFILVIPFSALLAPAVAFFFNFAAEAHVLLLKNEQNKYNHRATEK